MSNDRHVPDDADRYFLYAIGVDLDLDAQLGAIRTLLERHRAADADLAQGIKRLEETARAATGFANELAVDEWLDSMHRSVYQDAAHSLAAVGMLAPLLESILVHSFASLRAEFGSVLRMAPPRLAAPKERCWDCHWHVSEGGKWKKGIVHGTLQLSETIGLAPYLPALTRETLSALFAYRSKNFHLGLEWPADERSDFAARIEREQWTQWFRMATTDNKPWLIYMSSPFVDHCLDFTGRLLDGLGAFVQAAQRNAV